MANIIEHLKRIKPVFHRSSSRMKVILTIFIIAGIIGLFLIRGVLSDLNLDNRALESQAALLEQENEDLAEKISIQGTKEAVIQIARELLGLVTPDTVIVQPEG